MKHPYVLLGLIEWFSGKLESEIISENHLVRALKLSCFYKVSNPINQPITITL